MPDRSVTDPLGADRPIGDDPAGEQFRPPGPHHVVDPADVSPEPVLSPNAHEVSDAEGELLVTEAADAPPSWASSRLIAGAVALILMLLTVGIGAWLAGWLSETGDEALRGGVAAPIDAAAPLLERAEPTDALSVSPSIFG
ncbi:hypothetical protein [Alienimonas chondri]|uniref:Uncharacterized protein n=1 Tax=Alienimonas chondri TaxID=2681879 RepID=A0ABX1VHR9_9PLAN|nr:hypothetical protein [Alienimonas chondri]NNJ26813.1 hypothetical protein [Alienimonas chondri]